MLVDRCADASEALFLLEKVKIAVEQLMKLTEALSTSFTH